ncbi:unnamed protein product, partial [Ectocarpus sp. 12 AP-2014]
SVVSARCPPPLPTAKELPTAPLFFFFLTPGCAQCEGGALRCRRPRAPVPGADRGGLPCLGPGSVVAARAPGTRTLTRGCRGALLLPRTSRPAEEENDACVLLAPFGRVRGDGEACVGALSCARRLRAEGSARARRVPALREFGATTAAPLSPVWPRGSSEVA